MYYQLAIENKVINDYELINIYEKLSDICRYTMKITDDANDSLMAIKYGELDLQSLLLHYSANDIKVRCCLDNLADIYKSISDYDAAFRNYNRSLEIYLTQGTQIDFQLIYGIVATIIHFYIHYKHDYDSGLKYGLIRHEHTLKYDALCPQDDTDAKKGKKHAIADI